VRISPSARKTGQVHVPARFRLDFRAPFSRGSRAAHDDRVFFALSSSFLFAVNSSVTDRQIVHEVTSFFFFDAKNFVAHRSGVFEMHVSARFCSSFVIGGLQAFVWAF
jgi:hypothetical protein